MKTEPEYITIIEGPTPEFRYSPELSLFSIQESYQEASTVLCELRTNNGRDIIERCQTAWQDGRPVRLDFPDEMRMRQELDVVAVRLDELDEGAVLQVWVRHPLELVEVEDNDDDGEEDNFLDDDDSFFLN